MNTYIRDLMALPKPPLLTREQFVARYMPQYVKAYTPNYRIRTYVKDGRVRIPRVTQGGVKAQVTKRNNRIDSAYADYVTLWNAA